MKYDFDLIIIGSGAGGSVGAHYAVSMGKKVAVFEKGTVGGECPNFACVPTKALLHAADVYETVQSAAQYGIKPGSVKLDYHGVKKWKDLVVSRTGVSHGAESFKKEGITLIQHKAQLISPHEVEADGKKYSAERIVIATGSETFVPPIPGLKESGYITFKEAVDFSELPESLFILGGGPIGCEFTQVFASFGVKVTLADTLPKLIAKEDSEVSDLIQGLFENRGVNVLTGVLIDRIEKKGDKKIVHYKKGSKEESVTVSEILVATGKRPVLNFGVEEVGIKVDHGHVITDKYLQTSVPSIYAAGDIVGPWLFTHTGYYQSYIAVHNAFSRKKIKPDYTVVPRCVFTNPEVASVGYSESQARAEGIKVKTAIAALGELGRANTSNEFNGFVKIITDRDGVIIGGAIVGSRAGEMIHEIAMAVQFRVYASVLANMLHAYPTFSEGIKIACSLI